MDSNPCQSYSKAPVALPPSPAPPQAHGPPHPPSPPLAEVDSLHLPSASSPEMKGGSHTDLWYILLIFTITVLVYLGLKIRLPWR